MKSSSDISVLIVDRSQDWGPELRSRLAPLGIHVHVVCSREAALRFASAKKIDVAVLEYAMDKWTEDLCSALSGQQVPYVYTARQTTSRDGSAAVSRVSFTRADAALEAVT